jgi:hypothetical protein
MRNFKIILILIICVGLTQSQKWVPENRASHCLKKKKKFPLSQCVTTPNVICTSEYQPVCGLFGPPIVCITAPCGQTYCNRCHALNDERVADILPCKCPPPGYNTCI